MKKFFIFPKFEWKYLLFLAFFIFSFIYNFVNRWISLNSKDVAQPFINVYLFNVSDYISLIPFLIIKIRLYHSNKKNKAKLKVLNTFKSSISTSYQAIVKKEKNFYIYMALLSIFDFMSSISSLMFYLIYGKNDRSVSENNLSSLLIFNIIIIYVLSRFLLNTYFYRHHYFSFFINIICILILGSIDIINIVGTEKKETTGMIIFYIAKKILTIIFYSIEDIIGKKILMKYFIDIYTLLLYRGLGETGLFILFAIPFIFVEVTDVSDKTKPPQKEIIYKRIGRLLSDFNYKIILFTISNFLKNTFIWLIIDFFSPSHYAVSSVLESLGNLIRLWIIEPDTVDRPIMRLIIFLVLIVAGLIHTELIVFNFLGLQKNTKLFLEYKEKEDLNLIENNSEKFSINEGIDLQEYKITDEDSEEDINNSMNNSNSYSYETRKSRKSKKNN